MSNTRVGITLQQGKVLVKYQHKIFNFSFVKVPGKTVYYRGDATKYLSKGLDRKYSQLQIIRHAVNSALQLILGNPIYSTARHWLPVLNSTQFGQKIQPLL